MIHLRSLLLLMLIGCSPELPDGVFACNEASDCPRGWHCDARGGVTQKRCFEQAVFSLDASQIPAYEGPGQTFTPDEAGMGYKCGTWQVRRRTDPVPADAVAYGMEYTEQGPRDQYVCRFDTQIDGKRLKVQGRAIFGQGCLAALPAGAAVPERTQASATFELLVDTKHCGVMQTLYDDTCLLPTGTDGDGKPTYSCLGIVLSSGGLPGMSRYLGRFDPATKRCLFEQNANVRKAPSAIPDLMESIQVLAGPC